MIKAITGTKDILPIDIPKWKYLENLVNKTMEYYNYKEIRTPVFEETALFRAALVKLPILLVKRCIPL